MSAALDYIQKLFLDATKVRVAFGTPPEDGYDLTYVAVITPAHADYDGFGTISLLPSYYMPDGRSGRLVLIASNHFHWQVMRYSSGLATPAPFTDDRDALITAMFERFVKGEKAQ